MNLRTSLLSLTLAAFCTTAQAQDVIIKMNGTTIEAKVLEIDNKLISYNKYSNPTGPVYKIAKTDVEQIEYENGTVETFNTRKRVSASNNNAHYGNNVLAIAPMQVNNGGVGIGISYERILDKNAIISLYIPIRTSLRSEYSYMYNTGNGGYEDIYTTFFMPGVKVYPTGAKGVVRYAIGANAAFMFDKQATNVYITDLNGNIIGNRPVMNDRFTFGLMVNNSLNINPTPHLYLGCELALGFKYYERVSGGYSYSGVGVDGDPMAQFAFNIGYRF